MKTKCLCFYYVNSLFFGSSNKIQFWNFFDSEAFSECTFAYSLLIINFIGILDENVSTFDWIVRNMISSNKIQSI